MNESEKPGGTPNRSVLFHAEYKPVQQLCDRITPKISIGTELLPVRYVGMDGLSFSGTERSDLEPGLNIPFKISLGEEIFYEGQGVIADISSKGHRFDADLKLKTGHMEVGNLMALHEKIVARAEIEDSAEKTATLVTKEYRRFCADVVYTLKRYKRLLNRIEERCGPSSQCKNSTLVQETYELCERKLLEEWSELWREGAELVYPYLDDPKAVAAIKAYSEAVITPELLDGPIWRRSYEKPLGYPGDYRIMRYVYDWDREGATTYGKLCHRIGLEVGKPVATRMLLVKEAIHRAIESGDGQRVLITSLGSGPAYEVSEVLTEAIPSSPVTFTLIDQEKLALNDAFERIMPISQAMDGRAELNYWRLSYKQMLDQETVASELPKQNLIYCIGLLDYLPQKQAQLLVQNLFERLEPGGVLLIGNMKAGTDNVWPLKFVLDWDLIYRDEHEMEELTKLIDPRDSELKLDETGYNYLMFIVR